MYNKWTIDYDKANITLFLLDVTRRRSVVNNNLKENDGSRKFQ